MRGAKATSTTADLAAAVYELLLRAADAPLGQQLAVHDRRRRGRVGRRNRRGIAGGSRHRGVLGGCLRGHGRGAARAGKDRPTHLKGKGERTVAGGGDTLSVSLFF